MFYVDLIWKNFTESNFLTDTRTEKNFVAYKTFNVIENWQDFTVQLSQWVTSLYKDYILGGEWYRQPWNSNQCFWCKSPQINLTTSMWDKLPWWWKKKKKGWESDIMFNSSAAVRVAEQPFLSPHPPLLPSNLTTTQWCLAQPSSNKAQRPAFILLLHCEGLLTPPSQSLNLHAEGWQGLSITSWPWGTQGIKEALWDIYPP